MSRVRGHVRAFYFVKGSPALLAVSGPPPVCRAGGAGDGTAQHSEVGPLLGAGTVAAIHVDAELVYLLSEVVEDCYLGAVELVDAIHVLPKCWAVTHRAFASPRHEQVRMDHLVKQGVDSVLTGPLGQEGLAKIDGTRSNPLPLLAVGLPRTQGHVLTPVELHFAQLAPEVLLVEALEHVLHLPVLHCGLVWRGPFGSWRGARFPP